MHFGKSILANRVSGAVVAAPWALLALLVFPSAAVPGELGVKVEPGVTFPLTEPQSDRFDMGGGAAAKLLFGFGRYFDLTAGVSYVGLPRATGSLSPEAGTAWGYGGGLRLKGPRDSEALYGMSPWLDGDAMYVRTGSLDRLGFAAGAGLAFPIGASRNFWLGPYVRYQQILGRGDGTVDGRDAKLLLAGLSFEFGASPMRREVAQETSVVPVAAVAVAAAAPVPLSDRDADGTSDGTDLCPDVAGLVSNQGCPRYEKVVVKPDKLELKDKIQFAWNSPAIDPASHAALDEVVKALEENRSFRVRLEGHASSEGENEHNQTLSEQRAQAVLDYLVGHGVGPERLVSKGFSSSVPTETNTTAEGREANRRVEFVVNFFLVNTGSAN
jgi:OmpA-OmpF porin, OOP family